MEDTDQDPVEPITPALTTISLNQIKAVDPAPTVMMRIITPNGSCQTQVLPDSGADISAVGEQILSHLNEHRNNLLPSEFAPHAANGQKMKSIGKMCVQFWLADKEHSEEMYIFPNMRGGYHVMKGCQGSKHFIITLPSTSSCSYSFDTKHQPYHSYANIATNHRHEKRVSNSF